MSGPQPASEGMKNDADLTRRLVSHVRRLTKQPLPAEVMETAKHCLLDWTAVSIAGAREPLVSLLLDEINEDGLGGTSTIVHCGQHFPLLSSAMVNAAMADALDFSDGNLAMRGHTTPAVIATSIALAEALGKNGQDLLLAIIAGIETECRIGLMVNPPHLRKGFHPTGSLATFGAAAAAGHLLDLSPEQTAMALGLAATQAAGLLTSGGTMAKPFHSGKAAFNGLLSARLAARGFVGRVDALDAPDGFLETHANGTREDTDRFDDGRYMILGTIFKSHAACQLTHSTIDNILALQSQHGVLADDVEAIEVQVPPGYLSVCNISTPKTGLEAKFSLRGMVAMTLLGDDTRDIRSYEDERVQRLELSTLCERIEIIPRSDYAGGTSTALTRLKDGRSITLTCDSYHPASDIAIQREAVTRKFRLLVTPIMGEASAHKLETLISDINQAGSIRSLTSMLAESRAST